MGRGGVQIVPRNSLDHACLSFDRWQFDGSSRTDRAARRSGSVKRAVAYSDRMHFRRLSSSLLNAHVISGVPEFAWNLKKLRTVIATYIWTKANCHRPLTPEQVAWCRDATLPDVNRLKVREKRRKHRASIRANGGYAMYYAKMTYFSWRLGWSSLEVAKELGVSPGVVRQALYRLTKTARKLGFETYVPRNLNSGRRKKPRR